MFDTTQPTELTIQTVIGATALLTAILTPLATRLFNARRQRSETRENYASADQAQSQAAKTMNQLIADQALLISQLSDKLDTLEGRIDDLENKIATKDGIIAQLRAALVQLINQLNENGLQPQIQIPEGLLGLDNTGPFISQ